MTFHNITILLYFDLKKSKAEKTSLKKMFLLSVPLKCAVLHLCVCNHENIIIDLFMCIIYGAFL